MRGRPHRGSAPYPARLALALETQHPLAVDQLQDYDRTEYRRLASAALRDILAMDYDPICEHCGLTNRYVRRSIIEGRKLWARLEAWPWRYWREVGGQPPDSWRAQGGGPKLDTAFAVWATGRAKPSLLAFC